MIRPTILALAAACALLGCGEPPSPAPGSAEAPAAPAPRAAPAAPREPAASAGSPAVPVGPLRPSELVVEGEGLRIFLIPSGSDRAIPFGMAEAEAKAMLSAVQGAPPSAEGENADCGSTYSEWRDGLTTYFSGGRFTGWALRPGDDALTTTLGIGIGSTRAELEGVYDARIAPSSLGTEFSAGGLAGTLDSPGRDARVAHLWAGAACVAR